MMIAVASVLFVLCVLSLSLWLRARGYGRVAWRPNRRHKTGEAKVHAYVRVYDVQDGTVVLGLTRKAYEEAKKYGVDNVEDWK